ncbi:nucleobase cation symporter-1 family protein [Aspergillus mulundensis]|uniref:NCS1 nucleoside transporter family protein n=1 Tax=Aspergillus mulundensis TaxID=1810919 RepID=A0A3D8T4A4_9EURO|nr:NCS1 nucleoside transporter family protein [Aspergillus mulundensis]RDW93374.1 NCS1 nucleoside transporter family protein [Aspergillus mulundensis]
MGVTKILAKISLPHESRWINDDIRPVDAERRTWGFLTFHNFWLLINCNISSYLTGSSLIPLGLTWWQAFIAIVIGNILATLALIASSLAGAYYHIGFPVFSRAVWGLWGSQFVIWNRIFLGIVWYGFQSWVGGQCIYLILLSWDPTFATDIPNTIPSTTGTTTAEFLCYIIFCMLSLPALWIRPHRIQSFFYISSTITIIFFLVVLTWSLTTMGPAGFGATLSSSTSIPPTGGPNSTAWLMLYGTMSTIGSIAAGILNQNDYARLSAHPRDAIWGQALAFPFYGVVGATIGILVTAATQIRLGGEAVWNPPTLFVALLRGDTTSGTRAAVFFAGLALSVSQLGTNLPGNALPGGLDLASVFPGYVNIRRGAYVIALVSPVVNPWRLVNTATTFLTVLSGYGVFLAPMTGLMAAHYLVVCRQKVNVDDLFTGDKSSIYWYTGGINWRAPIAWIIGVVPTMPGFVAAVNTSIHVSDEATEIYYINYLYGFLVSAAVHAFLHWAVPDSKLDAFVKGDMSAREVQALYQERWEVFGQQGRVAGEVHVVKGV